MTVHDLSLLKDLDPAKVQRAIGVLSKESDRGAILVAIAILDSIFTNRVEQLLCHGSEAARTRLTGRSLNSFASKVDLAYCIGIIPAPLYHDIQLLNKLRNRCAHDWDDFALDQSILDKYVDPMAIKRALNAANEVEPILFPPGCTPKLVLVRTLAALVTFANLMKPHRPDAAGETTEGSS